MSSLSKPPVLVSTKPYLGELPQLSDSETQFKCKFSLAPKVGTEVDVKLCLQRVDQSTYMLHYNMQNTKGVEDSILELIFCTSAPSIPGKTVVYSVLKIDSSMLTSHSQAEAQAEYMLASVQLLDDLVQGRLEQSNSSTTLPGWKPYDHRLDIEGMFEPTYNQGTAVKHLGFLNGNLGMETNPTNIDFTIVDKLKQNNTAGLRRVPLESRLGKLKMDPTGGFYTTDPIEQRAMDGILSDVASKLSKSIIDGNGVAGMSLPVRIFDQKGLLERVIGYWAYAPLYLKLAAAQKVDKLERLKLVVTS